MKDSLIKSEISRFYTHTTALWSEIRKHRGDIDAEHNRISVLAPKVDKLSSEIRSLAATAEASTKDMWKNEELVNSILHILRQSGIIEEAVTGADLFQLHSTVDRLQRNPLYKINKVVKHGKN